MVYIYGILGIVTVLSVIEEQVTKASGDCAVSPYQNIKSELKITFGGFL
jgi:hypothetical protein